MTPHESAQELFSSRFGGEPELLIRAPGRVNLIGEHTDYSEGFVMPMAIERSTWLALRARDDRVVRVASVRHQDAEFHLDRLEAGAGWAEYVKGVAWALHSDRLKGWEGALATDIPIGAGLSSSAALEIATAFAFASVSGRPWEPKNAAVAARRADNEWVGIGSGIMDHLIVAIAEAGHATLIDCRNLGLQHIPLPSDIAVVILDTATRRRLIESEYDERRTACEIAAASAGVPALRDLAASDIDGLARLVDETTLRRARHVITENARTRDAAAALVSGDVEGFGVLMNESHRSLREDYEVSTAALDVMVDLAQEVGGCVGARMTGAGFGGCAVALVRDEAVQDFVGEVIRGYSTATGIEPAVYVTKAAAGASVIAARPQN